MLFRKMGYLEQFGFKIYRLREVRADSEFLLYNINSKMYNSYSENRLHRILLDEFQTMKVDLREFAMEELGLDYKKADPSRLIIVWKHEETVLIDNLGYCPTDDIIFRDENKLLFNTYKKSKLLLDNNLKSTSNFPNIEKLILNLVGNNKEEYDYFIKWIGWQLQNPLKRLPTSIILQGEHGTGKTKFCELILKPIFGDNFCEIGQSDINKEYNEYIMGKQLIVANEVIHNDNKFLVPDKLKNYVTDEYLSINRKFKDTIYVRNYSQWIFVTNNQIPLKIERGDRRYSVFQSRKLENGRDLINELMKNYNDEIKSFLYHLLHLEINYEDVDSPIENEAKKDLIKASFNSVQEFYDFVFEELKGVDKIADYYNQENPLWKHNDKYYIITNQFYKIYKLFCEDNGYNVTSKTYFTRVLKSYNFVSSVQWKEDKSLRVLELIKR